MAFSAPLVPYPLLAETPLPSDKGLHHLRSLPVSAEATVVTNASRAGPHSAAGATDPAAAGTCGLPRFPDLELVGERGRGGLSVVYEARQRSLDRRVAVKVLRPECAGDESYRQRLRAEARALARLNHSHVVHVFQQGQGDTGPYFSMELLNGPSLQDLLGAGDVPVGSAVRIARCLARTLHYIHGRGLVHRDLKPANLLLDQGRRLVVIDFGLAKFLDAPSALTQAGAIMGTPGYLAPEQVEDVWGPVGPASDVYAVGAVLYALLTGRAPYEESTPLRTILRVIGAELPLSARCLRPQVPEALDRVCMKCLCKRPSGRYPSALALVDALSRLGGQQGRGGQPA
jgi:serine/threonine protein kinase